MPSPPSAGSKQLAAATAIRGRSAPRKPSHAHSGADHHRLRASRALRRRSRKRDPRSKVAPLVKCSESLLFMHRFALAEDCDAPQDVAAMPPFRSPTHRLPRSIRRSLPADRPVLLAVHPMSTARLQPTPTGQLGPRRRPELIRSARPIEPALLWRAPSGAPARPSSGIEPGISLPGWRCVLRVRGHLHRWPSSLRHLGRWVHRILHPCR